MVSGTLEEATVLAILLDNACQIQLLAQAGGGIGERFPAERVQKLHHDITRAEHIHHQLRLPAAPRPAQNR